MARINRTVEDRQKSLKPVKNKERTFTIAGAKIMYEAVGKEIHCTISRHCRTQVFEFPRSKSCITKSESHEAIFESDSVRACLVTDLADYFAVGTNSPHYSISPSLRFGIKELEQKIKSQRKERFPVFVVIEDSSEVTPVRMDKGECCIWDEVRMSEGELQPVLVGGRAGKQFITAWATADGNWPEVPENQHYVNMILAAVRVEQETEGPIRKHLEQSCFVTDDGRFVDTLWPTMSARGATAMQLDERVYKEKARRIRKAITRLEPDMQTAHIALLINAMYADEYKDDTYNRLQYLRLWQSLSEAYKKHLGYSGRDAINEDKTIIAGKKTLEELTKYRNDIAHWWTGSIDEEYLSDIVRTINELLRRKYF